jgi:hypothetical protein
MTTRIVRVGNTLTDEISEELVALVSPDSPGHRHIRAGIADLEAGKKVSNERVTDWLDSWGTENELPAPK